MLLNCEICNGVGGRAAQTRSFVYAGQNLRCLQFVACCDVCGHCWRDEAYENANLRHVERACHVEVSRQQAANELPSSIADATGAL